MKRLGLLMCLLSFFVSDPARGETYQWTDEKGTLHFVDDLTLVPERYRDRVRIKKSPDVPSPSLASPPSPSRPEPQGSPVEPAPSSSRRDRFGRDEAWWRQRAKESEDKLQTAQKNHDRALQDLKAKQKELEDSRLRSSSVKRKIRAEIKALEEKVTVSEKQVNEAREMVDKTLPKQAEEDRADSQWLRPNPSSDGTKN